MSAGDLTPILKDIRKEHMQKTITLELVKIWFVYGGSSEFWILNGLIDVLVQDIKFIQAYGEVYNPATNETDVNKEREFAIRMDAISFIEFKKKFKDIQIEVGE
jgi:hypothetical protein